MSAATEIHRDNIVLGSGELFIDLLDAAGRTTGERYLGDAAGATISATAERVSVFGGTGPVAARLVDKVRSLTHTIGLTLHDMSAENWALFVGAGAPATVTDEAAAVADEALVVRPGRWYQLGVSDDSPTGVGAVAAGVVVAGEAGGSPATVYDDGGDYRLDAARGRLYIVPGGAVAAGATVYAAYTPVAAKRFQVRAGGLRELRAAVRYIEDTQTGAGRNVYAPLCSVSADGEAALMSRDTEQRLSLSCEVVDPGGGRAALYIDGAAA